MKNKLKLLILVVPVLFSACTKNNADFKTQLVEKMNNHNSIHYTLTEKYYYSNGVDTTITPYEIWVIRDPSDTVKNAYIRVDNNYRPYNMFFEKGNFYLAIPPKKTSILYPNFTEELVSPVDWISIFLHPEILVSQINDSSNSVEISDTIYDSKNCTKIKIQFPKNLKNETIIYSYIINNSNYIPLKASMQRITAEYTYYDELYFSLPEFDKTNIDKLKQQQENILQENPIEQNGDNSEISRLENMLHIGDEAPTFIGNFYSNGNNFELNNYIGKNVIIVDFWYTHCPPCVKAMPALSELNKRFKDKGLKIFGLNSVDNQKTGIENLNKFLSKRQLSYDIILVKPEVDIMYKVNAYPTMYIVDKEGKIAYVEIGYNEKKFNDLINKVEKLLEK